MKIGRLPVFVYLRYRRAYRVTSKGAGIARILHPRHGFSIRGSFEHRGIIMVHTAILQVHHISHGSILPYCRYVTYHTGPYCHTVGTSHITLVHTAILQVHHTSQWSIPPYFTYITYHTGLYHHTTGTSHITLVHTSGTSHIILVHTAIL